MTTLIVFSHLRWDFVYQRPQHLLSRLANYYKVIFIEEPVYSDAAPGLDMHEPVPNVFVCRPHTPVAVTGFHDDQLPYLHKLVQQVAQDNPDHMVWLYTPMALPLLRELHPSMVIYDCMDELAAFKNAPRQLLQRETALYKVADVVFTGGVSLYRAKQSRHANVHCFPSSVDVKHFEQALDRSNTHPLMDNIPHPRLGYYGVIDERFDLNLLKEMAESRPEWQIVLVGPVLKIDQDALPRLPNIHYLGQQSYDALPQFLAGWDVCLLLFALNESTRFISPTKTLEYMAAALPVVSTPIVDVVETFSDCVRIAAKPADFIAACDDALSDHEENRLMRAAMSEAVHATSWENTALRMVELLESTLEQKRAQKLQASDNPAAVHAANGATQHAATSADVCARHGAPQKVNCLIVGGGPTGLSAAYHLGPDTVLLEKNQSVGGWCRSISDHGFTFDYAGHIMFSNDPYVQELYRVLLGDNVHWQDREAWVYSKKVYTRYPFQGALYGLPPKVISECVMGAIEARYPSAAQPVQEKTSGSPEQRAQIADCCADGTSIDATTICAPESRPRANGKPARGENFEEFIYRVWGAGIGKHFALPYNRKLWAVPLTEMETSWLGGRVPLPDLEQIIEGALEPVGKPMGPNARFGYPLKGGFQALMNGFLLHVEGDIELGAGVVRVRPSQHLVELADGRQFTYDKLVSTMPLPELIRRIGDGAPESVRRAAKGLRHVSVRCVNFGVQRDNITDKHWIYYPEDTVFHRIFVQGNASPGCNPPGGFGLTCEITYSPSKPLPVDGAELIERCRLDCIEVGMLRPDDKILVANQVDMPYAYVVYDHERSNNVAICKNWLEQQDILLSGRYSEWEYYNSDHAFLAGKKVAERVIADTPVTPARSGMIQAQSLRAPDRTSS
ncbi:hypothetical protein BH11PSE11_BH11PSE11_21020 [soil metagenome]